MYEAKKIANYIIHRKYTQNYFLTNMRINKLIYFIHGWSLNKYSGGLIRNHFEAWNYGPVVRTVYDELKHFRDKEVDEYIYYLNYASGLRQEIPFDDVEIAHAELMDRVLLKYSRYKTSELVDLSHAPGGAWHRVWDASSTPATVARIPNELIREEFFGRLPVDKRVH